MTDGLSIRRVFADDLTGACECAGLAASRGFRTRVRLGSGTGGPGPSDEVAVYDLDCRTRSDEGAARAVRERFESDPTGPVYFKIDSVFRGPIGAMLRAAAECLGVERVLLCCAVPYTERWTMDGVHTVQGVPLDRTVFAQALPGPIRSAHLPTILQNQVGERVVSVRCDEVAGEWPEGARWAIADARSEDDLRAIARAWRDQPLSAGAGGWWKAILDEAGGDSRPRVESASCLAWRRPLVVSGSTNPVSQDQIRRLREARPDVACVAPPEERTSPDEAMRGLVERTLAALESNAHDGLILSGGHTSRAILEALGIDTLEVVGQIAGVLPEARADRPGGAGPLNVVVKPGSYGASDLYERIFVGGVSV
ncbi:hypothetical protein JW916_11565 [Candidatus Sumerlaeota bacterium]|nr:hypothetical protein [Candidatus Sumerlaeota bacterium]